jgi:histidinol phosphate phosphatase hisN-like protein
VTPDELRSYLTESRISGWTKTPRADVVRKALLLAEGDEDTSLGLAFEGITAKQVLEAVAALCACSGDLSERSGDSYIDPDATMQALELAAGRLAAAARRGERVLVATGHPTGVLPLHMAVARALDSAGAKLLMPAEGGRLGNDPAGRRRNRVRYLDGVAVLSDGASLFHTHEAWPMERMLAETDPPDLVLADHGFAGAAIARGVETVSIADVNDPALPVAKAVGLTEIVIPLDDNVSPALYVPLAERLEAAISDGV